MRLLLTGLAAIVLGTSTVPGQAAEPPSGSSLDGVRFTYDARAPIRGSPVVHDGVLYAGSSDGVLHALDARSGAVRWRHRSGGAIVSPAAVAATMVCYASRDAVLRCLDRRRGRERWRVPLGADRGAQDYWDYFQSAPVVVDDLLLVGSGDGRVRAVVASNGHVRWTFDAHARVRTTIAVHDGVAVFGAADGRVHALRVRDGALRWTFATEGASHAFADRGNDTTSVVASPVFAGEVIVVGGRDGFVYGVDRASGRERWRTTHDGSSWILSVAYDGTTAYVGSGSAQIVQAIDPATGAERWRAPTAGAVFASVVVTEHGVLVADLSGMLQALDPATGASRWRFPLGDRAFAAPLLHDGVVYAAADNGVLFALQVGSRPAATTEAPRRLVHRDVATARGFRWFQNGVEDAFTAALVAAGYERIDGAALLAFLGEPAARLRGSVIVLADNRVPAELRDDGGAAVRRFLDAGGKLVLTGPNPWAYVEDRASGDLTLIDFSIPGRIFDVRFSPPEDVNGHYASVPTAAGRARGLRSVTVTYSAIDAQQASDVLAVDEFGRASAWRKSYGGPRGSGLLQLALPRQRVVDYAEFVAAIDHGVAW